METCGNIIIEERQKMIELYVRFKILIIKICNIIKLLKFSLYLCQQDIFGKGNPDLLLKVIKGYLELDSDSYRNSIVSGRSVSSSVKLISTLIDEYFESKSDKVLNQILEVLKVEFIKRECKNV